MTQNCLKHCITWRLQPSKSAAAQALRVQISWSARKGAAVPCQEAPGAFEVRGSSCSGRMQLQRRGVLQKSATGVVAGSFSAHAQHRFSTSPSAWRSSGGSSALMMQVPMKTAALCHTFASSHSWERWPVQTSMHVGPSTACCRIHPATFRCPTPWPAHSQLAAHVGAGHAAAGESRSASTLLLNPPAGRRVYSAA